MTVVNKVFALHIVARNLQYQRHPVCCIRSEFLDEFSFALHAIDCLRIMCCVGEAHRHHLVQSI